MIYVAAHSRLAVDVARAFASRLASIGIETTSVWHKQTDEEIARKRDLAELQGLGRAAAADIRRSKAVVVFLAHGSREAITAGALAVGFGVPVIVVGYPDYHTCLLNQDNVFWVEFFGDAFDMIKKQYGEPETTEVTDAQTPDEEPSY